MSRPKVVLALDTSKLTTAIDCLQMYEYEYEENLRLATADTEAMDKGTLVHNLSDIYYNLRGLEPNVSYLLHTQAAIDFFKKAGTCEAMGYDKKTEDFLCTRFGFYTMKYGDGDFRPIVANGVSSVELGFSKVLFEDEYVCFIVEGRIDLIAARNTLNGQSQLMFIDHKTQDRMNQLYVYKPQFLTYSWATGYRYGMINYIGLQKEIGENTFRRQFAEYPLHLVERWKDQMIETFWKVFHAMESGNWKRDMTRCAGAFDSNPCAYTHLCECRSPESVANLKNFKYKKVEPWTPWKIKVQ